MGRVAACLAVEFGLSLPVGAFAVAAFVAGLTGVGRVDELDQHPRQLRLVDEEGAELRERPAPQPILRIAAPGRNPLADAREVFQGNPAPGALGGLDELLADDVVLVAAEAGFLASHPLQLLPGS